MGKFFGLWAFCSAFLLILIPIALTALATALSFLVWDVTPVYRLFTEGFSQSLVWRAMIFFSTLIGLLFATSELDH